MSGVVVKEGARFLAKSQRTVMQMHTHSSASNRPLATAAEVLKELPKWFNWASDCGRLIEDELRQVHEESGHAMYFHGQGLMWGGAWAHPDQEQRRLANVLLKTHCDQVCLSFRPSLTFLFAFNLFSRRLAWRWCPIAGGSASLFRPRRRGHDNASHELRPGQSA